MITRTTPNFRFYKEDNRWFVHLPEWEGDREELEMVAGADLLLDILANGNSEVTVHFTDQPTPSPDFHTLTHTGDGYYQNSAWHGPSTIWLCHVTEFVFGRYPEKIYYKRS